MIPNSILDQTALEESFFFCEYAKRRFEMSYDNNGHIEDAMKYIKFTSQQFFKADIPEGMQIDLLSDAIYCHEARIMGLRHITKFEGIEEYIEFITFYPYIEKLLRISNIFKVCAAFLPFPYDMVEVAKQIKRNESIPTTFKTLDKTDKRCVIAFHSNRDYVFFGIDKNLHVNEIIDTLKKKATLFKSINDYENCKRKDILNTIHKQSNLKMHRQSLNNVFYKSTGLLIYDLYVSSNFNLDSAFMTHRRHAPQIKCDPSKNPTSEDCANCKYFSSCTDLWRKQFNAAVEKISGAESAENWLNLAKKASPQKILPRRAISFFEYKFGGTAPSS
ncbi:hypothetical protein [Desulfovibrio sp.]|uniref:hypothetical protein n=1 Tax=Desulfovibrio sp. TaxID=885 RepID=UPI0025C48628|nr:hypothetical protein [Desulfovibrio sp.]